MLTVGADLNIDINFNLGHKQDVEIVEQISSGALQGDDSISAWRGPLVVCCGGEFTCGNVHMNDVWGMELQGRKYHPYNWSFKK